MNLHNRVAKLERSLASESDDDLAFELFSRLVAQCEALLGGDGLERFRVAVRSGAAIWDGRPGAAEKLFAARNALRAALQFSPELHVLNAVERDWLAPYANLTTEELDAKIAATETALRDLERQHGWGAA
jgi:hypothetical protein